MIDQTTPEIARLIAFYLPQYHPIPENDEWWGKGFTEWRNVTQAKPRLPGHYQPHLPADLGFYDLRIPEVREEQALLASSYGISGFCYYHYWFNGRRLLERPFNEVLASGKPDFPFCLCWANENWTRRWDGMDSELLMEQKYSAEDDRLHMQSLAPALRDSRNIRVDGKALFLIYRSSKIPNPRQTTEIWREEARKRGVGELFLCRVESFTSEHADPVPLGFDAAIEFQPDWELVSNLRDLMRPRTYFDRLRRKLRSLIATPIIPNESVFEYDDLVQEMLNKPQAQYRRFPCVTPCWDNSARRKAGAVIFQNSTPEAYGHWLQKRD